MLANRPSRMQGVGRYTGKVEGDVLVNKVVRRLALFRLRTLGDKLTEIKAEAMVHTLSERLGHLEI